VFALVFMLLSIVRGCLETKLLQYSAKLVNHRNQPSPSNHRTLEEMSKRFQRVIQMRECSIKVLLLQPYFIHEEVPCEVHKGICICLLLLMKKILHGLALRDPILHSFKA
jgi:hypothetical protein